jgi:hypothetical protein
MSGNYPAGVTDNHPYFDQPNAPEPNRDDAIDALQQAGMEPMDTAPKDREIVVILDDAKLTRERAYWQDNLWPVDGQTGAWWAANGDGAPDSPPWPHWQDDELLGWLEVAP